jgi:hypothetical protein
MTNCQEVIKGRPSRMKQVALGPLIFLKVLGCVHYLMGRDHLTMSYFDNLNNVFSNKYYFFLWICSSRLMVIQISCNFIIV